MYLSTRGLLTSHHVNLMDTKDVAAQPLLLWDKNLASEAWMGNGQ